MPKGYWILAGILAAGWSSHCFAATPSVPSFPEKMTCNFVSASDDVLSFDLFAVDPTHVKIMPLTHSVWPQERRTLTVDATFGKLTVSDAREGEAARIEFTRSTKADAWEGVLYEDGEQHVSLPLANGLCEPSGPAPLSTSSSAGSFSDLTQFGDRYRCSVLADDGRRTKITLGVVNGGLVIQPLDHNIWTQDISVVRTRWPNPPSPPSTISGFAAFHGTDEQTGPTGVSKFYRDPTGGRSTVLLDFWWIAGEKSASASGHCGIVSEKAGLS